MKKYLLSLSTMFFISSLLVGCNSNGDTSSSQSSEPATDSDTLKIYTTLYPLEDFTKKIGGDLVEVENVIPPGADAHTFEPSTKDMVNIAEADGFIYSGVGLETFAETVQESLKDEDVRFINAGEGLELLEGHDEAEHEEDEAVHEEEHAHDETEHSYDEAAAEEEHVHDHGDTDPHVWIDPILSIQLAENIKNALTELNPDGKETFENNFEALKTQLNELDQSFSEVINNASKKEILVSHAAYGYWESRYGIEQISVLGLSPTQEPSQKELQTIIETAKEHDIKYIIFETNVSSNVTDIVQSEIGAEALTLNNLETLTDEDIANKEDYFSIMKKNIETLEKALN
ncbi:metal ABC transporter substrate-binding protein [Metabacillus halosaccharovorans]|uniref:metal ABC transporter substrate-binding protein n=1 Tax=Metabacillus halosaccharovorans TaxID=930124 RepID=UPI002041A44C|nr:metal ABC transporter substrate-binding protein [Metabacillus halosaccharovorans]MCM3444437.1 metal ABC transporter substrate-binding protein [Metabacillus halosaccharovorans]